MKTIELEEIKKLLINTENKEKEYLERGYSEEVAAAVANDKLKRALEAILLTNNY